MAAAPDRIRTLVDHEVATCPRCGQPHAFKLKALAEPRPDEKVPIFGGTAPTDAAARRTEVLFTCPNTATKFSQVVSAPAGVEITGVAADADIAVAAADARSSAPSMNSEFYEWAKKSRDTATDFCKTMLSASTGGIPVYFAVAKYVGLEKLDAGMTSRFGIVPPILFLVAAISYVLALRPTHALVASGDFTAFRQKRLKWMNQLIVAGTAMFVAAVALAIVVLFIALTT